MISYPINQDLLLDLFDEGDGVLRDVSFLKRVEKEIKIDDQVLSELYFNHLVLAGGRLPKITSKRSFIALIEAYKKFSKFLLSESKEIGLQDKLISIYLFGFYKDIAIKNSETISKTDYDQRLKVISQCNKYTAIPYMIEKKEKFIPIASQDMSARALETIKNIGEPSIWCSNLLYWGLVFVALLNEGVNSEIQDYFMVDCNEIEGINITFQRFISVISE